MKLRAVMYLRNVTGYVSLVILSACTTYTPINLPTKVNMPQSPVAVAVQPVQMPFDMLRRHVFNPADGFDIDELAMLAVANNPQLRQTRDNLGVVQAQAFAAGLLPDPQLGFTADHPTNGGAGTMNAFNFNLSYDLNALLLHSSRKNAANFETERINMELLWQEWQVVSQTKLLFTRVTAQDILIRQLQAARNLWLQQYEASQSAMIAGNVTLDLAGADFIALQNTDRQINELDRNLMQNRASLNSLLGLAATAEVELVGEAHPTELDAPAVFSNIESRLNTRPDLQALKAGYESQEEKYRGAILAQFPALNVGVTRARDTAGLYTMGFGLSLSLPIFNRNRGNIAIEQATRKKLLNEYQNRLNSAHSEIALAVENLPLLQKQLQHTQQGVEVLRQLAQRADIAYQAGNLVASDYVRLQIGLLDKETESINLAEALMEQRIALETLLGPNLPELRNNK
jgi:outer membrane protein TolC